MLSLCDCFMKFFYYFPILKAHFLLAILNGIVDVPQYRSAFVGERRASVSTVSLSHMSLRCFAAYLFIWKNQK